MKGSYRLTPEADNDLVEIWHYTFETWGIRQANSCPEQLETQFLNFADQPGMGISVAEIRQGYRSFHHQRHLIFYRSQEKSKIEIIRILHERMAIDHQKSTLLASATLNGSS